MTKKKQERVINPLPSGIRVSIFDKSKNKNTFIGKETEEPHNQVMANTPQFRINQHKGA